MHRGMFLIKKYKFLKLWNPFIWNGFLNFFCFIVISSFFGCTPGSLIGSGKDENVANVLNYRRINSACSNINLSSSVLNNATFRSLLSCFNANGALEPIDQLINGPNGLTDQELSPIVTFVNKYLLGNKERLYEVESTFHTLDHHGILDSYFTQIGRLLENDEFISSGLSIFKDAYLGPYAPDLLKTIEAFGKKLTDANCSDGIELGINISDSKSFINLQQRLRKSLPSGRALQLISDHLFKYFQENHVYTCNEKSNDIEIPIKDDLIQSIINGEAFATMDEIFGTHPDELKRNIPDIASLLAGILKNQPSHSGSLLLEDLANAIHDLSGPIRCMKATTEVPNAAMHIVRELANLNSSKDAADYVLKDNILTLIELGLFCNYPNNIDTHYKSLENLAKMGLRESETGPIRSAIEVVTDIIKAAYRRPAQPWMGCDHHTTSKETYYPLVKYAINLFADAGKNSLGGIHHLIPSLATLSDRDVLEDLLLLATLPTVTDQNRLKASVSFLTKPLPELKGKNIFDTLSIAISASNSTHFYHFSESLRNFINMEDGLFSSVLENMRRTLNSNNIHPFLGLFQDVMNDAGKNDGFYRSLFLISDRTEFLDSVHLISTMAKDGRLKELLSSVITLFHKFAVQGQGNQYIVDKPITSFFPVRRHDLAPEDLNKREAVPDAIAFNSDCSEVNLNFSLDRTNVAGFDEQLQHFLRCQNTDPQGDIATSIQFLRDQKTENGESFYDFQFGLAKRLVDGSKETHESLSLIDLKYLVNLWKEEMDNGRLFKLMDAFVLFSDGPQQILKPFFDLSNSILSQCKTDIQELESYLAKVIKKENFPKLMGELDDLFKREVSPVEEKSRIDVLFDSKLRSRIKKWIEYKECSTLSNDPQEKQEQINKRSQEIIDETQYNLTNWDLLSTSPDSKPDSKKGPRKRWELEGQYGLKNLLEPIFKKFGNREESIPDKDILNFTLNFLKNFTRSKTKWVDSEGSGPHYEPSELLKWLYQRSTDYRLITYFYPGELTPRVRLVNTLDLFELTLINVDFDAPAPLNKNLGLEFLAEIADAWGDIKDRKNWPPEIQAKYPDDNHRPMTLLETVNDLTNKKSVTGFDNLNTLTNLYIGLPKLPNCHKNIENEPEDPQAPTGGAQFFLPADQVADFQVRLYNIWQTVAVLKENVSGSQVGFNGGLELLRDLFYEIHYSTPEAFRGPTFGDKNNLSIIMRFVRMGLFRQMGRILQNFNGDEAVLKDFFTTLIRAATAPHAKDLFSTLFISDHSAKGGSGQHELIWKVLEQLFDIIDHGTHQDLVNLKQFALYSVAILNHLAPWEPSTQKSQSLDLLNLFLWRGNEVIKNYNDLIKSHADLLGDILTTGTASSVMRSAYEETNMEVSLRLADLLRDFLEDTSGRTASSRVQNVMEVAKSVYEQEDSKRLWKVFKDKVDNISKTKEYKDLKLDEEIRPILLFLEERNSLDGKPRAADEKELANKFRNYLASMLQGKDLDQYLILSKNNPEKFYKLLSTLSKYMKNGDHLELRDLLKMMRRSVDEPRFLE